MGAETFPTGLKSENIENRKARLGLRIASLMRHVEESSPKGIFGIKKYPIESRRVKYEEIDGRFVSSALVKSSRISSVVELVTTPIANLESGDTVTLGLEERLIRTNNHYMQPDVSVSHPISTDAEAELISNAELACQAIEASYQTD